MNRLEEIHERMDQMGNQVVNRQATPNNSRRDEQSNKGDESQFKEEDNEEEQPRRGRPDQNNQRRHKNRRDDDLCLSRGSKNVDDYHKEMEITMIRANILEDQEGTMA
ncbi:hypothetical protein CR513_10493, partial [Mucuna pruriens]